MGLPAILDFDHSVGKAGFEMVRQLLGHRSEPYTMMNLMQESLLHRFGCLWMLRYRFSSAHETG